MAQWKVIPRNYTNAHVSLFQVRFLHYKCQKVYKFAKYEKTLKQVFFFNVVIQAVEILQCVELNQVA